MLPSRAIRRPRRGRLAVEEQADVDQLLQGAGAHHPGVGEQRIHDDVIAGGRRGVGRRAPPARRGDGRSSRAATGLRWATARAIRAKRTGSPNDSRYSSTTFVFGSSAHNRSRSLPLTSTLFPTETNDEIPAIAPSCFGGDGDADTARLRRDGDAAGLEGLARDRGVEPARRGDDTEAVRSDEPHAVTAGHGEQLVLPAGALLAGLGEASGDDDRRRDPGRAVLIHRVDGRGRGDGHHSEVGHVREVVEPRHGLDTADEALGGMDDADRALEAGAQVGQDPPAGRCRVVTCIDHDHMPWLEERSQRAHRRAPVTRRGVVLQQIVGRQVELHVDDAVVEPAPLDQADGAEHRLHGLVPRKRFGDEPAKPGGPGDDCEVLEQDGRDSLVVVRVGHGEGDLGLVGVTRNAAVLTDPDECPVGLGDEGDAVAEIVKVARCSSWSGIDDRCPKNRR